MISTKSFPVQIVRLTFIISFFASSCDLVTQDENVLVLSTMEVTQITQTTAMSGGNITTDREVTEWGVCWSTEKTPTISDNKTVEGLGGVSFTSKLTGLYGNTIYHVRSYATSSEGTAYGSTMIFKTLESAFTDSRDGKIYKMVTIGDQVWMAENLGFLPSVFGPGTGSTTSPHYYVYGYSGTDVNAAQSTYNYATYGVLYNWPAAMAGAASSTANPSGIQGICPTGWHLPSDAEWIQLTDYLGGSGVAGDKLKEKGTTHWNSPNMGASNETSFTALPGGFRLHDGTFIGIGNNGLWWSASEESTNNGKYRSMLYNARFVNSFNLNKELGFCVRCIRD